MATKTKKKTERLPSIIGFKELRENADKYISAVGQGRVFTVVRRSKPIFKMLPVDEWGDEGTWETVVDFTDKKNPKGTRMEDFAKMLKKSLNGQKSKISQ
jgi:antitoxin (DNA-binding transcriptional repressor) of toxin-antitoxin stability system